MLVKDVIIKACDFIDNEELSSVLKSSQALGDEERKNVDKLVKCFNLVRNEIVSEYMPIVKEDRVKVYQNLIGLETLSNKMVDILSVKDDYGNDLKFELKESAIRVESDGYVTVKYNSLPKELSLQNEFSSRLPDRVYAYGVVREYYFLQSMYEDAKIWDERFKSSLQIIERKKGETIIPRRRWI